MPRDPREREGPRLERSQERERHERGMRVLASRVASGVTACLSMSGTWRGMSEEEAVSTGDALLRGEEGVC